MVLDDDVEVGPAQQQEQAGQGDGEGERGGRDGQGPGGPFTTSTRLHRVGCWHQGPLVVAPARWAARYWCSCETTTEPSPTAEATRLTDECRTSPTAKKPGRVVS